MKTAQIWFAGAGFWLQCAHRISRLDSFPFFLGGSSMNFANFPCHFPRSVSAAIATLSTSIAVAAVSLSVSIPATVPSTTTSTPISSSSTVSHGIGQLVLGDEKLVELGDAVPVVGIRWNKWKSGSMSRNDQSDWVKMMRTCLIFWEMGHSALLGISELQQLCWELWEQAGTLGAGLKLWNLVSKSLMFSFTTSSFSRMPSATWAHCFSWNLPQDQWPRSCCCVLVLWNSWLNAAKIIDWNPYIIVSEPSKWSKKWSNPCVTQPDSLQQKDWRSIYTTSTHILLPICKISKGDGQKVETTHKLVIKFMIIMTIQLVIPKTNDIFLPSKPQKSSTIIIP